MRSGAGAASDAVMSLMGFEPVAQRQIKKNISTVADLASSSQDALKETLKTTVKETVSEAAEDTKADLVSELNRRFAKYAPQLKAMGGGLVALLGVYLLARLFQNRGGGGGGSNVNVYANAPAQNAPARRWNSGSLFRG